MGETDMKYWACLKFCLYILIHDTVISYYSKDRKWKNIKTWVGMSLIYLGEKFSKADHKQ